MIPPFGSFVVLVLLALQVLLPVAMAAWNGTLVDKVDAPVSENPPSTPASPWKRPPIAYDRDLVIELIEAADYPLEKHVLTTSDGYILKMHRIPDPLQFSATESTANDQEMVRFGPRSRFRGSVLLVPGMFSTPADFVVTGPENGLAYVLADAGYDVWMANVRGSRFARKHVRFTVAQIEFWDFSFHEIGTIDIAAIIDYILRETNQPKVYYVGHNQGMTGLLALLATKPRYNRKIHHAVGLASLAYLGTTDNRIVRRAAELTDRLYVTLRSWNVNEIKPSPDFVRLLSGIVCAGEAGDLCREMLRSFLGTTVDQSRNLLPIVLDDLLSSISTRQLIHFGQLMQTRKFQQFDHKNQMINMQKYAQAKPPEYNLSRVRLPVSLFHGQKDFLTSVKDAMRLKEDLINVKHFIEVPDMNHLDFVYSEKLYARVNRKIIEIFNGW